MTTLFTQKIKFCLQNFFLKKCLFEYENQFAVEKNTKYFLAISKILIAIKKMLAIQFPYLEIV